MESPNRKLFSILSYIGILFVIGLFAAKEDEVVKFHANQGAVLFILTVIINIIVQILIQVSAGLGGILSLVGGLVTLAFAIIGIINAVKGEQKELPVIGGYKVLK